MQCRFLQFLNFLLLFLNFHFAFEKTILKLPIHTLHSHRQFSGRKRSFHEYISRRHRHWLHYREARPSGRGGKAALRRVPAALRAHAGGAFGASARGLRCARRSAARCARRASRWGTVPCGRRSPARAPSISPRRSASHSCRRSWLSRTRCGARLRRPMWPSSLAARTRRSSTSVRRLRSA